MRLSWLDRTARPREGAARRQHLFRPRLWPRGDRRGPGRCARRLGDHPPGGACRASRRAARRGQDDRLVPGRQRIRPPRARPPLDPRPSGLAEALRNVTHVDGTARVQTVQRNWNPEFAALLEAFHARTGIPALLNTSFNRRGMPMVERPEEAVALFAETALDALVLHDVLVRKRTG
ncbi:hypothetical protein CAP40_18830 [Sphingomonas sp. IBVSS2]|nr:hypothetical protein CAP40_18830 [Sphingomonas sp. IBVSS2]